MNMKRYARQIALKSIGEKGQETLLDKTVLIIGAGGTGSAAADLFSRLGIKKIILIDRDKVEISNLHRQILYDNNDVGKYKVDAAEEKIRSINPDIEIETFNMTFDSSKAEMVKKANIIFDGTDNMTTRFIINDACDKYNKPWIFTSASEIYGEFKAIIPGVTSCYACYNKEPVETPDCSVTGVLNSLPSMVSSFIAAAMKSICPIST